MHVCLHSGSPERDGALFGNPVRKTLCALQGGLHFGCVALRVHVSFSLSVLCAICLGDPMACCAFLSMGNLR